MKVVILQWSYLSLLFLLSDLAFLSSSIILNFLEVRRLLFKGPIGHDIKTTAKIRTDLFVKFNYTYFST